MGQYYHIINVDKHLQLCPFDYGNGLKLMEWAYDGNFLVLALMNLLADEWKGDRVYVIGDYADADDMEECWAETYVALQQELGAGKPDGFNEISIYGISDEWPRVLPDRDDLRPNFHAEGPFAEEKVSVEDFEYRYIYNHETRQVIDLAKCPIEWIWYDKEEGRARGTRVSPLALLLAMGNGRGGGDYRPEGNVDLVGSWAASSASIDIQQEPLESCADYEEFTPDFTENEPPVPYTDLERLLAEREENEKAKSEGREEPFGRKSDKALRPDIFY